MQQFVNFIRDYVPLSADELSAISRKCKLRSYRKDAFLLQKGQVAQDFIYLKKGSVRFYKKEEARETIIWIAFADNLAFEMSSYFTQKPTELYVQALEEVEVYVIARKDVEQMLKTMPVWQEFYRKLWEETIVHMIERIMSLLKDNAEVRYDKLVKDHDYLRKVPIKDLASFIGIAPGSLSRLRSKTK